MDSMIRTIKNVFAPFVTVGSRLHPLWHVTGLTLVTVLLVLAYARRRERLSIGAVFKHLFPASVYRHWSSWLDVKFFVVDRLTWPIGVGLLVVSATFWTELFLRGLVGALGDPVARGASGAAINLAYSAFMVLVAMDLAGFLSHFLMHKVPTLWEFHKVHHAAVVLNPLTNHREHPVDQLLRHLIEGPLVGAVNAVFMYRYPDVALLAFYGIPLIWVPFNLTSNLRHTHLWLPYPAWLSRWFISPAMHQTHHGSDSHHVDINFGRVLSIWDRLASSLYIPRCREPVRYGIGGEEEEFRTLRSLYFLPFRKAWQNIWRPRLTSWGLLTAPPDP